MGGLVSSAIIIGLVDEHMQLSGEETNIFRFVKNNRKEKRRKYLASKLVYLLLKMKVHRGRELSKGNIKWREIPAVV